MLLKITTELKQIESLLKVGRREAYQKGWDDAIKYIVAAAEDTIRTEISARKKAGIRKVPAAGAPKKRAKRGSVQRTIKRILKQAGNDGLTASEIHEHSTAKDKNIAASSIRQKLRKMQREGEVVKSEEGRWVLAQRPLDVEQKSADNPVSALPHASNGGSIMPPP